MKWVRLILALAVVAGLAWWVRETFFVTEPMRIRRVIGRMESAIESGRVLRLESCLAQDYADDHGLDKATMLGAIRQVRGQYESLFIHLSDLTVTLTDGGQGASVVLIAKVLAKPQGTLEPTELFTDRFRLYFRHTGDGWKLVRTESPELKFE